ncbi:MAG: hypothetical protein MMC23_001240 [Stictis urceolatum]|nr:hypothetical protein [Stictis urceolata]
MLPFDWPHDPVSPPLAQWPYEATCSEQTPEAHESSSSSETLIYRGPPLPDKDDRDTKNLDTRPRQPREAFDLEPRLAFRQASQPSSGSGDPFELIDMSSPTPHRLPRSRRAISSQSSVSVYSTTSSTCSSTPTLKPPFEPSPAHIRRPPPAKSLPRSTTRIDIGTPTCYAHPASRPAPIPNISLSPPLSPTYSPRSPYSLSPYPTKPTTGSPLRHDPLFLSLTPATDPTDASDDNFRDLDLDLDNEIEIPSRVTSRFSDYGSEDGDWVARLRSFSITSPRVRASLNGKGSASLPGWIGGAREGRGLRKRVGSLVGCVFCRK